MLTKEHAKATVPALWRGLALVALGLIILGFLAYWATDGFTRKKWGVEWADNPYQK